MPELRQNFMTKEWVVIATERAKRPDQMVVKHERKPPVSFSLCTLPQFRWMWPHYPLFRLRDSQKCYLYLQHRRTPGFGASNSQHQKSGPTL